jgi:hypothetical protein
MPGPPSHRFHTPADALEYEIVQEQAAALGRLGRELERSLAALRAFDARYAGPAEALSQADRRRALVAAAGHALWLFVVQREACGLRDSRTVMRDYNVPGEVLLYSGCPEPVTPLVRRGQRRLPRQTASRVG